ncbi:hypothetical protein [Rhodococcus sp. 11-3]|uniref:hypothetical protein n=1 Tax=Rhodococcus sp. 11-3 TaxID=2854796 RepID=UPI00203F0EA5|nr:hypothetical protein [Rhodococcus sp. 11-3]USC17016.1 hypothetical protein KZJ41_09180 [Rhodococcus sp. 11-3]
MGSRHPGMYRTAPSVTHCGDCGARVLACWHEGWHEVLEDAELSQVGEIAALMSGRRTFELCAKQLYRRTPYRIRNHPAPVISVVLTEHVCGTTIERALRRPEPEAAVDEHAPPPF